MISPINLQYIPKRQTSYEIQFDVIPYENVEAAELMRCGVLFVAKPIKAIMEKTENALNE